MATLKSLAERLERLEQQATVAYSRRFLLYVHPGEDEREVIERQKRELGVREGDEIIVIQWVAAPVRDE
jgi:hypothetical protein